MRATLRSAGLVACAALLGLATTSCSYAGFRDAYMASDSEGNGEATVFPSKGSEIHAIAELVNHKKTTVIRAKLNQPSSSAIQFEDARLTPGVGDFILDFKLAVALDPMLPDELDYEGPWNKGEYSVELFIDDDLADTLEFTVK